MADTSPLHHSTTACSLAPLDDAMSAAVEPQKYPKQPVPEATATQSRPVLRASHSLDFDEAQLLAETEELLGNLDPTAFVDPLVLEQPASFGSSTSNDSSSSAVDTSGDDSSVSQSPKKLNATSKSNCKRKSKPGAMRNPSRERLQNELTYLRKQVLVLENDLQNAQAKNELSQQSKAVLVPKWERVAKRELACCDRAVQDNKRLKSMLELQKELVVRLEESLYNWQHATVPLTLGCTIPGKVVHLEPGDDVLFKMLVSELNATHLELDSAFQEAGIDTHGSEPFTRSTAKTRMSSDGRLRSYFELIEVDLTPFDFEMTTRVARICGEQQSQSPDCVVYNHDWGSGDFITEKHRVKRVFNGVEIYFHMLLALQVHEYADHVVSVWRSMFKSEGDHFPDAYVQETGWMISSPLGTPTRAHTTTGGGSLYRMCVHLEPRRFTAPAMIVEAATDTMTTLVVDSYQDDMQELETMMENMLIQECLKSTL